MAKIPDGLEEGQKQELTDLLPEQHFTQPPPRYSEASLVRLLEELGIGPTFYLCPDPEHSQPARLCLPGRTPPVPH